MLHALGFRHEQERSDSDKYIRFVGSWAERTPSNSVNYGPYDLQSIMQYSLDVSIVITKRVQNLGIFLKYSIWTQNILGPRRLWIQRACIWFVKISMTKFFVAKESWIAAENVYIDQTGAVLSNEQYTFFAF